MIILNMKIYDERTIDIDKLFDIESGKELTQLFLKNDVILLVDVFENFFEVSNNEFDINPLCSVSLPGYVTVWNENYEY